MGEFGSRGAGNVTDNAARVGVGPSVRVGEGIGVPLDVLSGVTLNGTNGL